MAPNGKPDIVSTKAALVKELTKNSAEIVESWKQTARDQKAQVLGSRQRVLNDLMHISEDPKMFLMGRKRKCEQSTQTVEQIHRQVLSELQKVKNTEVVEDWKKAAISERTAVFDSRRQIIDEITRYAPELKTREISETEKKSNLLSELRKDQVVVPEWKQKQMVERRMAIENKNTVVQDIYQGKGHTNASTTPLVQRSKMLEAIRQDNPVENWKQNVRDQIATPMLAKHQLLNEIQKDNRGNLNHIEQDSQRAQMLKEIRAEPVEGWKEKTNDQRRIAMETKHTINCEIPDASTTLTKIPSHTALMEAIRQIPEPTETVVVEGWKQSERDAKANAICAKKHTLVALDEEKIELKQTQDQRKALMQAIRTEPVEAWKEKLANDRVETIKNKHELSLELANSKPTLTNPHSPQLNKTFVLSELRQKSNNVLEGWKETQRNDRAMTIGNKTLLHNELSTEKLPELNKTKSTEQVRQNIMQEIRAARDGQIPLWQEAERIARSAVHTARQAVMCDVTEGKRALECNKPFNQIKIQVLHDIRRNEPVEAWKEKELEIKAALFDQKKLISAEILEKKTLENNRRQGDLKEELLKQVRLIGNAPIPEWKENKMQKAVEVYKNRVELNHEINQLKL